MKVIIHEHAFVHGITAKQILHAFDTGYNGMCVRSKDRHREPIRLCTIGFDENARMIELVIVRLYNGHDYLIIHANYMTKQFSREIREVQ
ncbi:hypothetical protein [Actinotignum urinale]|uniref:hypothetical protein n=1 Tax=Actinotignum urinale TaxID=190146 RepID=UPI00280BC3DD|nr:hypothetical protein [Actinotignum urinale]